jgi:DNA-binding transcriptional ArsR family regulator
LQSLVAFDVFVGPQLLAMLLGISPSAVNSSLSKLKRAGLVRSTPEGEVGITYRVLRDVLPESWRHPGPLEALRMAVLLIDNGDWYAIARRAELVEAQHRSALRDASRLFALAAKTAKAGINDPDYVRDESSDEDSLERAATRCRARAKAIRLRIQRTASAL